MENRRDAAWSSAYFQGGEGLAIAAALEDETYPIDDLVFDLANIRAGPRFAGEDSPLAGRLGALCQRVYERADHPGYLEMGVPMHYGAGASEVIREVITHPSDRYRLTSDSLRHGDVERALLEWRSLLRHIAAAPDLEWDRWTALKSAAQELLGQVAVAGLFRFPAVARRAAAALRLTILSLLLLPLPNRSSTSRSRSRGKMLVCARYA